MRHNVFFGIQGEIQYQLYIIYTVYMCTYNSNYIHVKRLNDWHIVHCICIDCTNPSEVLYSNWLGLPVCIHKMCLLYGSLLKSLSQRLVKFETCFSHRNTNQKVYILYILSRDRNVPKFFPCPWWQAVYFPPVSSIIQTVQITFFLMAKTQCLQHKTVKYKQRQAISWSSGHHRFQQISNSFRILESAYYLFCRCWQKCTMWKTKKWRSIYSKIGRMIVISQLYIQYI